MREGLRSGKSRERPQKDAVSSRKVPVQKKLHDLIIIPKSDHESCNVRRAPPESTEMEPVAEFKSENVDVSGVDCDVGEAMDGCQTNIPLEYKRKRKREDCGEGCIYLGTEEEKKKKVKVEPLDCEMQNVGRTLRSKTRAISEYRAKSEMVESGSAEIDTMRGQNDSLEVKKVKTEDDESSRLVEGLAIEKFKRKRGRPPKLCGTPHKAHKGPPKLQKKIGAVKKKLDRKQNMGALRKSKRLLKLKDNPDTSVTILSPGREARLKRSASSLKMLTPTRRGKHLNSDIDGDSASPQPSSEVGNTICINEHAVIEKVGNEKGEGEDGFGRASEKQLVRDRIIELLISAGWTIDYRPRLGKEYNDAVYVSPDGKTHWSVTLAYRVLKRRYQNGESVAYKEGFIFSPLPEKELNMLKKVITKRRTGKKADKGSKSREKKKGKRSSRMTSSTKRFKGKRKSLQWEQDDDTGEAQGDASRYFGKRKHRDTFSRKRYALLVRSSGGEESGSDGYVLYKGKRTILAWMIDMGVVLDKAIVSCMNQRKTRTMLEGRITKDGIDCNCCGKVVTVSEFESHAGSKLSQPLQNIYHEDGNSMLQCQLDAWKKQEQSRQKWFHFIDVNGDDPNDDTCGVCGDGGNLVCCDSCSSTFHQSCLNVQKFPSGDWHCLYCCCKFCGMICKAANRREDEDKVASLLLTCCFCEEKYHRSCSCANDATSDVEGAPSFCGKNCQEIYGKVEKLLGVKHEMEEGFSWTLLHRSDIGGDLSASELSRRVECNCKLAVALTVMDECFLPMPDHRSGINLIHNILYNCGSNFNRLNFCGFYTVTLENGDEIIAAASIRIHGNILAEMPFIGTRYTYRRQGMCRRLLSAIESVLCSLNVEKLVIPAISALEKTWTSVFGFQPVDLSTENILRRMNLLVFPGVAMLQKRMINDQIGGDKLTQSEGLVSLKYDNPLILEDTMDDSDDILPPKFDLNAAPEVITADTDIMGGKLVMTSNSQILNGSSNDTSDITTESVEFSNCQTDHTGLIQSGEHCDSLESKGGTPNGIDAHPDNNCLRVEDPVVEVDQNSHVTSQTLTLEVKPLEAGVEGMCRECVDMQTRLCGESQYVSGTDCNRESHSKDLKEDAIDVCANHVSLTSTLESNSSENFGGINGQVDQNAQMSSQTLTSEVTTLEAERRMHHKCVSDVKCSQNEEFESVSFLSASRTDHSREYHHINGKECPAGMPVDLNTLAPLVESKSCVVFDTESSQCRQYWAVSRSNCSVDSHEENLKEHPADMGSGHENLTDVLDSNSPRVTGPMFPKATDEMQNTNSYSEESLTYNTLEEGNCNPAVEQKSTVRELDDEMPCTVCTNSCNRFCPSTDESRNVNCDLSVTAVSSSNDDVTLAEEGKNTDLKVVCCTSSSNSCLSIEPDKVIQTSSSPAAEGMSCGYPQAKMPTDSKAGVPSDHPVVSLSEQHNMEKNSVLA